MKFARNLAAIALVALVPAPTPATAGSDAVACMPFAGESMVFNVGWEFINAGTAHMQVSARNGHYRIDTTARSNKLLDVFHKVRDTIISEGICRDGKLQSTLFDVTQNEGRYHARKTVRFLWRKHQVVRTKKGRTETFDVPPGHLNALDAFFAVRRMTLAPGDVARVPMFDSRKRYMVEVRVLGRKKLRAPWGERVNCIVIEPKLKTKGIFSSKGKVKIWLTDDARHIPLKMVARIKFGHIAARLTAYQPPQGMLAANAKPSTKTAP